MRRPLLLGFGGFLLILVFCLPKSFSDSPIQNAEFVYARIRYHMTSDAWRVREVLGIMTTRTPTKLSQRSSPK
jgi:hypothetical protein